MSSQPDGTAVLVALWRALHTEVDPAPHVLCDRLGLELVAPPADWRQQAVMDETFTRPFRSLTVARARLAEDVIAEARDRGVDQYVVLGAGLDTFALRCPQADLDVFEVDAPATQDWKRARIAELGWTLPERLRFVPVDFETGRSWVEELVAAGFAADRPAVVSALGLTVYLSQTATVAMLTDVAALAAGTLFVCGFDVPEAAVLPGQRQATDALLQIVGDLGCPAISRYSPEEFVGMARAAGFSRATIVDADELARRYFPAPDGLRPWPVEQFLVASVGPVSLHPTNRVV